MKKKLLFMIFIISIIFAFSSCKSTEPEASSTYASETASQKQYTITWQNSDGTVLKTDKVEEGVIPEYDGIPASKYSTAEFIGWSPNITNADSDITYVAQYKGEKLIRNQTEVKVLDLLANLNLDNTYGFEANYENYQTGSFSLAWNYRKKDSSACCWVALNLADYSAIRLNLYNEKEEELNINFALISPKNGSTYERCKRVTLKLKNGWNNIEIPLYQFIDEEYPNLSNIERICFCNWWNNADTEQSVFLVDSIYAVQYEYSYNFENYLNDSSKYDAILDKMKSLFIYNDNNPLLTESLITINSNAGGISINRDSDDSPISGRTISKNDDSLVKVVRNIRDMALAYETKGSNYYHDEEYLNDIIYALSFLYDSYFTKEDIYSYFGYTGASYNLIFVVPNVIMETIIMLKDSIPEELFNNITLAVDNIIALGEKKGFDSDGYNRCCYNSVILYIAVINHDYDRIINTINLIAELNRYVESGNGLYEDGTFIHHYNTMYNGHYGNKLTDIIAKLEYYFSDSMFEIFDEYDKIIEMVKYTFFDCGQASLFEGRWGTNGTNLKDTYDTTYRMNVFDSLLILSYLSDNPNDEILSFIKYAYNNNSRYFGKNSPAYALVLFDRLQNDEAIISKNLEDYNHIFYYGAKASAKENDVYYGISMSYNKTSKYEGFEAVNQSCYGWYMGDGMTYVSYKNNTYDVDYWKNLDYYHLAGATNTLEPRKEGRSSINNVDNYAKNTLCGGLIKNDIMVVGFNLISKFPDMDFNSTLTANKAYVKFTGGLLCIGNSISCADAYDTVTTIENLLYSGSIFLGDTEITSGSGKIDSNYIYIPDYGTIYTSDYNDLYYSYSNDHLLIYYNHGQNINNSNYIYALLPNKTVEEAQAEIAKLAILNNDGSLTKIKYLQNEIIINWLSEPTFIIN